MSSCILDKASEYEQKMLSAALQNQLAKGAVRQVAPKGFCYNCGEQLVGEAVFCDDDCRDDYQYIQDRRKVNAKVK